MADPAKRLDDISANLAEVLRHADALLDDWARFGASVRAQVEREAAQIGSAVADGTGAAVERAVATQLASLKKELAQLEARARAASHHLADQRTTDRRLLGGIAAGVGIAIALLGVLVVLALRAPVAPPVAPAPEPARAEPAPAPPPDARPIDAPPPADAPPPPADAAPRARHR